ncbi:hypothetical protein HDV01_002380 [Terramyces sp. JEL0728]|nr:hypothetical protein HDV01_002380 [Terramyces sp. JEL0728]
MLVWKLILFIFSLAAAQEEKKIKLTKEQVDQRAIEADKYINFINKDSYDDFEGVEKNKAFKDKDFKVAKFDCTEDENYCASKEALGYPTLMLFSDGKIFEEYTGEHKTKHIGEYLVQKASIS